MTKAIDIAKFLIRLAVIGEDEPDPLTHLRLQKLLYYIQGWHLAAFGCEIFRDRIEAWVNGPVVVDVWPHFKEHGFQSILPEDSELCSNLLPHDQSFIRSVWDRYKIYSATQLARMTHMEPPWKNARGNLPANEKSNKEITINSIKAYFYPLLAARMPKGIELSKLIKAENEISSGQFRTHQDLRARLAGA